MVGLGLMVSEVCQRPVDLQKENWLILKLEEVELGLMGSKVGQRVVELVKENCQILELEENLCELQVSVGLG